MEKGMTKIPTLQELSVDAEQAYKNDQLNLLLSQPTPEKWVKEHPFAKGVKYVPIDKVEYMLTRIFQRWHVEVREYKQLFNSITCHIRLHYLNPVNGEWEYQDGVGATAVQLDAGSNGSDISKIKHDAVMKALPAAKSYAVKDAAECIGSIFGANLNRKDVVGFQPAYMNGKYSPQNLNENGNTN